MNNHSTTEAIIEALYGPYISMTANNARYAAFREAIPLIFQLIHEQKEIAFGAGPSATQALKEVSANE